MLTTSESKAAQKESTTISIERRIRLQRRIYALATHDGPWGLRERDMVTEILAELVKLLP